MKKINSYLRLITFSHTVFAMPFACIGFFLGVKNRTEAGFVITKHIREFGLKLLLVLGCMVAARSAAMAFNRYLDRSFDARNPRTALREIPRGVISANSALRFVFFNSLFFMLCAWLINPLCFALSPIALLVVLFYSYTKRFTALCHLFLGLGLSLAPIGAYLAVVGAFHWLPILFSGAVIFWVSGFDVIYALQDVAFDQSEKLYSIPSTIGPQKALKVSWWLHFLCFASLVGAGWYGHFHSLYWVGLLAFMSIMVYQHALVSPTNFSKINLTFASTNGFASIIFGCFAITDMLFQ